MTLRYSAALLVLAASIGVAGTSCADAGGGATGQADTLYIGVAAARTSPAYFNGVTLAIERLNANRPKNAAPLGLRMPANHPSQVAIAAAFRDDGRVVGVVGHTGSSQTMAAAPIYADREHNGRNAVVAVTPTSTNPRITHLNDWIFRVCPTDQDAARALARYAIDSAHVKRVALVYRNDLFGRGYTRTITPPLIAGGAVIAERDPYLPGITEYRAYAERIARRGVDAVVFAGGGDDAAEMLRALHDASAAPVILGSDDVASVLEGARDAGEAARFAGVRFTSFYDANREQSSEGRAFVAAYRERWGETPTHQAALAYDAASLIGRAALAVGNDRKRVRSWIASVGRGAPPQSGITGEIAFDEHGDALDKPVLIGSIAR